MTRMGAARGRVLAMVAAWLVTVAVVGGVTFVVVSAAGRDVGQAWALRTVVTDAGPRSPSPTPPRPTPPATATRGVRPPTPARTSPAPRPRATTPTSVVPRSTPVAPTPPRPAPAPAPTTRTGSFTTGRGTLVASCTGSVIRRRSITVRDGWRFEDETDGRSLTVHFSRGTEEAPTAESGAAESTDGESEVKLTLRCVGGVPTDVS